jgi:hypothetical protein
MKEKGYSSLSVEQCEITKLTVEGPPREIRVNEECFHEMLPIHLLFLFHFQEALRGFHTPDFPDLCHKPLLGLSVIDKTLEHTISLCNRRIDLKIMSIRFFTLFTAFMSLTSLVNESLPAF